MSPRLLELCKEALHTLEHHQADISYLGRPTIMDELKQAIEEIEGR
jgi:hypothetical protein